MVKIVKEQSVKSKILNSKESVLDKKADDDATKPFSKPITSISWIALKELYAFVLVATTTPPTIPTTIKIKVRISFHLFFFKPVSIEKYKPLKKTFDLYDLIIKYYYFSHKEKRTLKVLISQAISLSF